jgi:hypothetical protein
VSGIYLGDSGSVEIRRTALNTPLSSLLDDADVNVARKRFSFDFDSTALITGDHIEIRTEDGSDLQLVAGHAFPDWRGYINVDQAGGIRLFSSFTDAINGDFDAALDLIAPTASQPILVSTRNSQYRFLARVSTYQFTTSRESLDLTGLGEEHRRQYASGLISGQGSLTCFWDYERKLCEFDTDDQLELSQYLAELVLRAQQGSSFAARLNLLLDGSNSVWWDCPICIVTNVAMALEPTQTIQTNIEFVTSGPLNLRVGTPPGYLLQESSDQILLESGDGLELENP